ncbi:MAG: ABC transporter substrate-binding protein [Ruminococcus sp.]|nr:ABC transporter substrate-binding protein [Ruminococcus sp.]
MMKKIVAVMIAAMCCFSMVACGSKESSSQDTSMEVVETTEEANEGEDQDTASADEESAAEDDTITITDHNGNVVTVPKNIERIAVGNILPMPSVLAVFFDSAEKIVGMPAGCMTAAENSLLSELYPEILNAETGYINGAEINIEELMKLDVDVVIYNAANASMGEQLANAGIPGVAVSVNKWDYDAIETLNQWIALLSEMFPENDRVEQVETYSKESYDLVQERVAGLSDEERARIFFLFQYTDSTIATSGNHFFGQYWADAIGAINVGEEVEQDNSITVNMEQIYAWNPEHILITNFTSAQPEDLYNNTIGTYDWSAIDAVKNEQAYKMPLGMYRSYTCGVDTPVTLLWMAKTVYPDLFEDIDITQETKSYYKDVFGIELTDAQAEMIFAPSSEASAF